MDSRDLNDAMDLMFRVTSLFDEMREIEHLDYKAMNDLYTDISNNGNISSNNVMRWYHIDKKFRSTLFERYKDIYELLMI